jgi:hypothetical protein
VTAFRGVAAPVGVCLGLFATACGGGEQGVEPVPISACGELVYEGAGEPEVIVVADNPRRGGHAVVTGEIVDAIAFVLRQRDFRAGAFRVGFQSCDDTVAGNLDAGQCRRNAQAYVETSDVVGVIGPYNSGCAELQIPIVSRTAAGPLAMISPANTFAGLTRGPAARPLYPDGVRSYVRLVTHDQAQAIAAAQLARRSGARRAAVVAQRGVDDPYVAALTEPFGATARALGIESKEYDWRLQESYAELAAAIAAARPDGIYLVGLPEGNAKTLIQDLRTTRAGPDHHARLVRFGRHRRGAWSDRRRDAHDRARHTPLCAAGRREEVPPCIRRYGSSARGAGSTRGRPGDPGAARRDRALGRNARLGRGGAVRDDRRERHPWLVLLPTGWVTSILRRSACTATRTAKSSSTASCMYGSTPGVASKFQGTAENRK